MHRVPFVFADRHAYLATAQFSSDLDDLNRIDWAILKARDFKKDPDDRSKFERYQAEALAYRYVPVSAIVGIVCHSIKVEEGLTDQISRRRIKLLTATRPNWYF